MKLNVLVILIVIFGGVFTLDKASLFISKLEEISAQTSLPNEKKVIRELTSSVFNFSSMCPGNTIRFKSLILNKDKLRFSFNQAKEILPYLHFMSFKERMLTWAYQCLLEELSENKQVDLDISNLDFFEGDILMTPEQMEYVYLQAVAQKGNRTVIFKSDIASDLTQPHDRSKRKVLDLHTYEWNWRQPIYWTIQNQSMFNSQQLRNIRRAFQNWQSNTCLRFVERTPCCGSPPVILIIRGRGCGASIGKRRGYTLLVITPSCANVVGTMEHEIGHTLGMWHEHSRPDRDFYVRVNAAYIIPGVLGNFNKVSWINTETMGLPYDYSSLMHYGSRYFFLGGSGYSMQPHDMNYINTIGQRSHFTFTDVKGINLKYCQQSCSGYSTLVWSRCKNHGYRDPKVCQQCRCQDGLKPPFCENPEENRLRACGGNRYTATDSYKVVRISRVPYIQTTHPTCTWLFKADKGQVLIRFDSTWQFPCPSACSLYVEVRTQSLGLLGPRLCCGSVKYKSFSSMGEELMVRIRLQHTYGRTFSLSYRRVNCGGSANRARERPCRRTNEYITYTHTRAFCPRSDGRYIYCNKTRPVFRIGSRRYCYPGYALRGYYCYRLKPTTTTTTTTTTAPPRCGGCGSTIRIVRPCSYHRIVRKCRRPYYNWCWSRQYYTAKELVYYCCSRHRLINIGSTKQCLRR